MPVGLPKHILLKLCTKGESGRVPSLATVATLWRLSYAADIVTVTKYGRLPGGRRDWRHETASQPSLVCSRHSRTFLAIINPLEVPPVLLRLDQMFA